MLLYIIIITVLNKSSYAERTYGEFRVKLEGVNHPFENHLDNSIANYRFTLSKVGKYETTLTANFQFHEKITDLKIQREMSRKPSEKMTSEYKIEYPLGTPVSLCFGSRKEWPHFQASLHPSIDQKDCSIEKGNYTLKPYSLEKELRQYVGNQAYYGHLRLKLIFVGKSETNPVFAVELFYSIVDALTDDRLTDDSSKPKHHRKNKGKANEND